MQAIQLLLSELVCWPLTASPALAPLFLVLSTVSPGEGGCDWRSQVQAVSMEVTLRDQIWYGENWGRGLGFKLAQPPAAMCRPAPARAVGQDRKGLQALETRAGFTELFWVPPQTAPAPFGNCRSGRWGPGEEPGRLWLCVFNFTTVYVLVWSLPLYTQVLLRFRCMCVCLSDISVCPGLCLSVQITLDFRVQAYIFKSNGYMLCAYSPWVHVSLCLYLLCMYVCRGHWVFPFQFSGIIRVTNTALAQARVSLNPGSVYSVDPKNSGWKIVGSL